MSMRRVIEIAITIVGVIFMAGSLWVATMVLGVFTGGASLMGVLSFKMTATEGIPTMLRGIVAGIVSVALPFIVGYWLCKKASGIARHFRPDQ